MKKLGMARGFAALAAIAVVATACSGSAATAAPSAGAAGAKYTVGFSNAGGVGNGWREAMLCSAKAQAVSTGNVS